MECAVSSLACGFLQVVRVENDNGNKTFDYFMVNQQTTQGCLTPVHYFCALNESDDVSKQELEALTYNLCYMYSNWAGSVKVPAPVQLAHKIADYHHGFDSGSIRTGKVDKFKLAFVPEFQNLPTYL